MIEELTKLFNYQFMNGAFYRNYSVVLKRVYCISSTRKKIQKKVTLEVVEPALSHVKGGKAEELIGSYWRNCYLAPTKHLAASILPINGLYSGLEVIL